MKWSPAEKLLGSCVNFSLSSLSFSFSLLGISYLGMHLYFRIGYTFEIGEGKDSMGLCCVYGWSRVEGTGVVQGPLAMG